MADPSGRVLSSEEVRWLRLRAQRLAEPAPRDALLDVVRDLVGVQAQMPQAAALSLRARVAGLTREDLREALEVRKTLVRTWVMRGTIHLVHTEDVRWMLPALPTSVLGRCPDGWSGESASSFRRLRSWPGRWSASSSAVGR